MKEKRLDYTPFLEAVNNNKKNIGKKYILGVQRIHQHPQFKISTIVGVAILFQRLVFISKVLLRFIVGGGRSLAMPTFLLTHFIQGKIKPIRWVLIHT